jgi:DNA-binding MarR family transcriptional regulator
MARLNPNPILSAEAYAVVINRDLHPSAKIIWTYLRSVRDPQRRVDLITALDLTPDTVTRNLRALAEHGLVEQNGSFWIPAEEVPA